MDMIKNTVDCLKSIKITKQCDSQIKVVCGSCQGEPISLVMKEDYSINMLQLLAGVAVGTVMITAFTLMKKIKG